ncbi:hypothetical protein [Streptomyces sp. NPDC056987]|uniref:hypothetical protein n=1 Tax=Streptomyces sp. NPDC056987 TaxID=3345988 RepID=UPI003629FF99
MPIPRPFDLDVLIAGIGEVRGRTIRLVPIPDRLLGSTSLHLHSTTRFHREKIIFRDSDICGATMPTGSPTKNSAARPGTSPRNWSVSSSDGNQAAGRRRYGTRKEARAETIADLMHSLAVIGLTALLRYAAAVDRHALLAGTGCASCVDPARVAPGRTTSTDFKNQVWILTRVSAYVRRPRAARPAGTTMRSSMRARRTV